MLESETATINGRKYEVTKLPYSAGKALLVRLFKVAGPTLVRVVAGVPSVQDKELGDLQVSEIFPTMTAAVDQLASDLSEEDLDALVSTFGEYSWIVDGSHRHQLTAEYRELHFAGNYLELFQWLAFALRVNYAGFFKGPGLASMLARAQTPTP
jgi:hypothetical protein